MNLDWLAEQGLERLPQFVTALAIGLLIGLERERTPTAKAGLRTFALVALAGGLAAVLSDIFAAPSIMAVGLGAVALMMIAAYYHRDEQAHDPDPGTTTIAAAAACYLLAAIAVSGYARLAVILAVLATVLLYFKAELGGAARGLQRRDVVSILQFAVVAFVVLPLLPDQGFGPYDALNPRHVWYMVVLVSGVSLAGYVAMQMVGGTHGAILLGLLGGLVSSTATTLAYSRHARGTDVDNGAIATSTTVILVANLVLLLRLAGLAALLAPSVLVVLGPVLGLGLAAGAAIYWLARSRAAAGHELTMPPVGNPTELRAALGFAALYAVVLVLAAWLGDRWGSKGVYLLSAASGLTDVDAITLSNLRLFGLERLSAGQVAAATVIAVCANGAFKLGIVRVAGGATLFWRCLPAMASVVAAAFVGLALFA